MIKYNTTTGNKEDNKNARLMRDMEFKPALRGMHCRKCKEDTVIEFEYSEEFNLLPKINACCADFEKRIRAKMDSLK